MRGEIEALALVTAGRRVEAGDDERLGCDGHAGLHPVTIVRLPRARHDRRERKHRPSKPFAVMLKDLEV